MFFTVLVFAFVLCTSMANAQETSKQEKETLRLKQLAKELEGTYQIQVINSRENPSLSFSFLDEIVAKRHKSDTIYFWPKRDVRIMILPESVIKVSDFKPLTTLTHIKLDPSTIK